MAPKKDNQPGTLAIIIPTYNNLEMLKTLVEQIYDYTDNFNLYIIDDGHKKDTIKYLKELDCHVIFHEESKGVSKSWNEGIKAGLADNCSYFAILNDDIELPKDWWKTSHRSLCEATAQVLSLDQPCPIGITGWFFILSREAIERVGLFDEQFSPYYFEDYDYLLRINKLNLKHIKIDLDIKHFGGKTLKELKTNTIWQENWQKLRKKYPNLKLQV